MKNKPLKIKDLRRIYKETLPLIYQDISKLSPEAFKEWLPELRRRRYPENYSFYDKYRKNQE